MERERERKERERKKWMRTQRINREAEEGTVTINTSSNGLWPVHVAFRLFSSLKWAQLYLFFSHFFLLESFF